MDNEQLARKIVLLRSCTTTAAEFFEEVLKLLNQHRAYVPNTTVKDQFTTNEHPSFGGIRLLNQEGGEREGEGTLPPHGD